MKNHLEEINYWYYSDQQHVNEDQFGSGYYGYQIIDIIVRSIAHLVPNQGKIVMLGTHRCHSFNLLCDLFGIDRCVGFDLYNPTHHPQVIVKDIRALSEADRFPIAFCYNDISSFPRDSEAKIAAQRWAAPALVPGGIFLGKNNLNRAQYNSELEMKNFGYTNIQFDNFLKQNQIDCHLFSSAVREGHMFSIKN